MSDLIAFHGDIVLPDRVLADGYVLSRDGRIAYVGAENPQSSHPGIFLVEGRYIASGFVDIHVHGGANADYMDGSEQAVLIANKAHTRHGTTSLFPTTTTGARAELEAMISACEQVQTGWQPTDGARIAGVHFYGPYFAEDKVGVHAVAGRRDPDPEEYRHFLAKEIVAIATCAAELPGAIDFYRFAEASGCFITCGHSNACWAELEVAFAAGVRHVDHFWCAMSSVVSLRKRFGTPMRAGMEQFVLANNEMSTEVIADGEHLADELLEFAYKMLSEQRLCLVTDANRALDCPPGEYRFGHKETGAVVLSDGKTVRDFEGGLASSMHGMDHMVRTMAEATTAPLHTVIRMASLTPAELTGIAADCGSLEIGKLADVLVLSDNLAVEEVYLSGQRFEG